MMVRVRVDVILMLNVCLLQNLQSINRQTMRFKPPPINSKIGWRVEFRPIEVSSEWSASISVLNTIPEKCSVYMCIFFCSCCLVCSSVYIILSFFFQRERGAEKEWW